jgi:hypothetical protein
MFRRIESHNQSRNAKWSDSSTLGIPLLYSSNELCDVFDGDGIFDSETMALCLDPGSVNEDAGIGVETCKGAADVGIKEGDFFDCSRILEFQSCFLLYSKDDN